LTEKDQLTEKESNVKDENIEKSPKENIE